MEVIIVLPHLNLCLDGVFQPNQLNTLHSEIDVQKYQMIKQSPGILFHLGMEILLMDFQPLKFSPNYFSKVIVQLTSA